MGKFAVVIFAAVFVVMTVHTKSVTSTFQPRAPNFQYFERPKYRYPFYDENGKGRILYGYGGPELYQYKTYTALEGIH